MTELVMELAFILFLLFLCIWLPCGLYTQTLAKAKGYDEAAWFFGGLLLGPMALLAAAGLPDLKLRRYVRALAAANDEAPGFDPRRSFKACSKFYMANGGIKSPEFRQSFIDSSFVELCDIRGNTLATFDKSDSGEWVLRSIEGQENLEAQKQRRAYVRAANDEAPDFDLRTGLPGFKACCELYIANGGKKVPVFGNSSISSSSIRLYDIQGDILAIFKKSNSEEWVLQNLAS